MEEKLNNLDFDERETLIIIANALYKKTGYEFYKNVVASAEELNNREGVSKTENTTWPEDGDKFWYLYANGEIDSDIFASSENQVGKVEIGNCFRTEEEAELAVKKLQALKRLRDDGVKFKDWHTANLDEEGYVLYIKAKINLPLDGNAFNALDLLFWGEE